MTGVQTCALPICLGKPLGEKGGSASGIFAFAAVRHHPDQGECGKSGFHLYQGAPGWNGCFEKSGVQSIGRTRGGWNTKLHMVAASDRDGVIFALSAGNRGDAPEGRALLRRLGSVDHPVHLLMDRAYERDETRALAAELAIHLWFHPKAIGRTPGSTINSCTNSATRLNGFFVVSRDFAAFLLAMINLMLSF